MTVTVQVDDALLREAQEVCEQTDSDALVRAALEEFIRYRKQLKVLELEGTIEYFDDHDPNEMRHRR